MQLALVQPFCSVKLVLFLFAYCICQTVTKKTVYPFTLKKKNLLNDKKKSNDKKN